VVNYFETVKTNLFPVTGPIDEIVAGLNQAKPGILMLYPSIIPRLMQEAEAERLRITPELVLTVAEPLFKEHEAAVGRVWKCAVINGWGATEVGGLAMGSGFDSGMLLMDDEVIVEAVDRNGKLVVPGQRAEKVYCTPLFRYTLPLLRYELTDQFVLSADRPSCGSGFQRITNVDGRLEDYFRYDDGVEVPPDLFKTVLGQESAVFEYQVFQTREGVHIVLTSSRPINVDRLGRTIASKLRRFMRTEPIVIVEQVGGIERTGDAAKLKRFIPFTL
jgi:phenylacetate-coenzyme A ligase PaaK-like adenylate-forming protein